MADSTSYAKYSGSVSGVISGTVPIANGGTGQTTKAPAFDALSPMTTGGDLIYGGASGTGTRLANGSAGQVLTSGGTTVAPTWTTPTAPLSSYVWLDTPSGFGSTDNKIRKFTNKVASAGTDLTTVFNDATHGTTITVNTAGTYSIHYSGDSLVGSGVYGISVNSNQLTTSISGITSTNALGMGTTPTNGDRGTTISVTLPFAVNDVIRPHCDGLETASANTCKFFVTRVN